jgi:hypothetical protein
MLALDAKCARRTIGHEQDTPEMVRDRLQVIAARLVWERPGFWAIEQ